MKSGHINYGKQGENLAERYLKQNGYKILASNFSTKIGELDIIATIDELLIIVEVKRRKNIRHGYPRESVHIHKQKQIIRLTQWYIQKHALHHKQVRFDVIEILDNTVQHIENAFSAG